MLSVLELKKYKKVLIIKKLSGNDLENVQTHAEPSHRPKANNGNLHIFVFSSNNQSPLPVRHLKTM